MKKVLLTLGIISGSVLVIWYFGSIGGFWGWYNMPSPSNEPGIMTGEHFLVSSFKNRQPYNFVMYKSSVADSFSMLSGNENEVSGQSYLHRLCAVPGDIIEMKKSVLYVNGKNFDDELDLKMEFLLPQDKINLLDEEDFSEEKAEIRPYNYSKDTLAINMHRQLRQKYSQRFTLIPYYITDTSQPVFNWYKGNRIWTVDNFGPLQIPADSCFVLGDNRHNSLDSRYTGFIAMKDISAVVINK